jgi:GntR family transcriptional regulator
LGEENPGKKRGPVKQRRIQPLYHQIYLQLRQLLTESALDISHPLPSEPMLAKRYGVSRVTIRKTLQQLQQEGLIRRSVLDNLLSFEKRTTAVTLDWEMVDAEPAIARKLKSERFLRITRLRSMEEMPISFTILHVPERYSHLLQRDTVGNDPIIRALEQGGVEAYDADQVLSATAASADIAKHLGVETGSPLIVMRRLMFNAEHDPVLHQESCYPPDRFEYRMRLSRQSIGPVAQWSPIS